MQRVETWQRNLYILIMGNFVTAASFSLVMPFLPMMLREQMGVREGLELWSGVAFAATFVTSAIMSPVWGKLADRYGRKVMVIRSGVSIGVIYVAMAFARDPYTLLVLRLLNGALSGFIPSAVALVATTTPDERLGRTLGRLQIAAPAGTICGPVLGGALQHAFGLRATLFVAAAAVFFATALVLFGVRENVRPVSEAASSLRADVARVLRDPAMAVLMFTFVLGQASVMVVEPILTLIVERLGVAEAAPLLAGFIFSLVGIASVIASPQWGKFGERVGYRSALALALLSGAALTAPQAYVSNPYVFALLRFGFGLGISGMSPLGHAALALAAGQEFRGRAFGFANSAWMIGGVVGPVLGGYIAQHFGYKWVFLVTTAGLALNATIIRRALPDVRPGRAGTGASSGQPIPATAGAAWRRGGAADPGEAHPSDG